MTKASSKQTNEKARVLNLVLTVELDRPPGYRGGGNKQKLQKWRQAGAPEGTKQATARSPLQPRAGTW